MTIDQALAGSLSHSCCSSRRALASSGIRFTAVVILLQKEDLIHDPLSKETPILKNETWAIRRGMVLQLDRPSFEAIHELG